LMNFWLIDNLCYPPIYENCASNSKDKIFEMFNREVNLDNLPSISHNKI